MKPLQLIGLMLTVTLVPLLIYTGYLSQQAYNEPTLFGKAQDLSAATRHGDFVGVQGPVTGNLLTHPDFPEIAGAISYLLIIEKKIGDGDEWQRLAGSMEKKVASQVKVDGTVVHIDPSSQLLISAQTAYRYLDKKTRQTMRYKPADGRMVTAYGVYDHGAIFQDQLNRLILVDQQKQELFLERLDKTSRVKGHLLAGMALFAGLVGLISLKLAVVGKVFW